ncbi:MAG: hypothetical protein U9R25_06080 [Chloroflexota bacterium]|nr:hypothetical protein [Chloroflexota bacterium]
MPSLWPVVLLATLLALAACSGGMPVAQERLPVPTVAFSSTPMPLPTPASTSAPAHTPTFTSTLIVTPSPTSTATSPPAPTPTPTQAPTFTPSPVPPSVTPTATDVSLPATPVPTFTPAPPQPPARRFAAIGSAQPDFSHPCPGCPKAHGYITGRVVDVAGNPLSGVRLVCFNDWHRYPVVASKGGGEYDFPILQAEAVWFVVVVDEHDQPLSEEVPVRFNPQEACWYRLEWQRTD